MAYLFQKHVLHLPASAVLDQSLSRTAQQVNQEVGRPPRNRVQRGSRPKIAAGGMGVRGKGGAIPPLRKVVFTTVGLNIGRHVLLVYDFKRYKDNSSFFCQGHIPPT